MKIYKSKCLNPGIRFSREKDLELVDENINKMVQDGWKLEHTVTPNDLTGAIIGIFSKDKSLSEIKGE